MRRWIRYAAGLYPQSWREEFGEEFRAVLDDVEPSWRVFGNVLRGAIEMRMMNGSGWAKLVAAMAIVGAAVGLGVSYRVAPVYVSSATIRVTPVVDPVRPATAEALRERVAQHVAEMETELRTRQALASVINDSRLLLYSAEQRTKPLEDVIEEMRRDLQMTAVPSSADGVVLSISFSYGDPAKARATVQTLVAKFIEANLNHSLARQRAYQDFWRDMASVEHLKSVPPAPVGEIAQVVDAASKPLKPIGPHRRIFWVSGLAGGILAGLAVISAIRWPRGMMRLAGFATAGCVIAGAASFLIPSRYTSTAVMMVKPPRVTEDPLARLPAASSAAAFLQQSEPEILSPGSLGRIIQDRRLNLYEKERGTGSMEDVIRKMRGDLHITPIDHGSSFSISFTYNDRYKAQQAVQTLISAFAELDESQDRLRQVSGVRREILRRKAGEVLVVMDSADLPSAPVFPNRLVILGMGLGLGVLLGAVSLRFWRPGPPQGDAPLLEVEVDGAGDGFGAGGMRRGDLQAI